MDTQTTPPTETSAPNTTPVMPPPSNPTPPSPRSPEHNTGPVIGIIVVIILLGAGAYYVWTHNLQMPGSSSESANSTMSQNGTYDQAQGTQTASEQGIADPQTESLKQVSSSDSTSDIEADLQSTNTGNLDSDLSQTGSQI